jgi:hypothetical protein
MSHAFRDRVDSLDWAGISDQLDAAAFGETGPLLTAAECASVAGLYDEAQRFRSTIDMARHRFGSGQYRYFAYPLPPVVAELRDAFYPHLLPIARAWASRLGRSSPWPGRFDEWIARCHAAGQTNPTPLVLRYGAGDWNALHRDLYGELVFPLQVVIGLDQPGVDHQGGELLFVEQRPRAQSRGYVVSLHQGHGVVFTTRDRPVPSTRGWSAAPVRHGVSTVRSGRRHAMGLVFHDGA